MNSVSYIGGRDASNANALYFLVLATLLSFFFALVVTEVVQFNLWSQVVLLWQAKPQPEALFLHPHGPRYSLVLPLFWIAENVSANYNSVFSLFVPVLMLSAARFIAMAAHSVLNEMDVGSYRFFLLSAFIVLGCMSLFMNGRLVFSLLAASILVSLFYRWQFIGRAKKVFFLFVSLFLASVSSGTFIVAFVWVLIFLLAIAGPVGKTKRDKVSPIFPALVVAGIASPVFWIFIDKNISFFDYGHGVLVNMLSHGMGQIFHVVGPVVAGLVVLVSSILVSISLFLLWVFPFLRWPLLMCGVAIGGGLFGYSAATMSIPPALMLSLLGLRNLLRKV